MSDTQKEIGLPPEPNPDTTPLQASIISQKSGEAVNKFRVVEALEALTSAVEDNLLEIRNALPLDNNLSGIEVELSGIAGKLAALIPVDPVIPGGPKDWVLRVYYKTLFANDETKLPLTVIARVKFPVIYWNGIYPVIADAGQPNYAHGSWRCSDLILRNGVDISGNKKTKKEHFGYWKYRAKFSTAVLNAKALPSGETITAIASECLYEVAGEDTLFPKTYRQFCGVVTNKFLLRKLQSWGYTKEVHEAYSKEFYPEGSYWTVEDYEQGLCLMHEIDTHKPATGEQQ